MADKENNAHKLQQEIEVISYKYDRLQKQSLETSTVGKKLISLTKKNRLEDSQLPTDKTWHSIMTEVDKIYPQFYSLLKEAFPNLTESEYQYAISISLDLTQMMNQIARHQSGFCTNETNENLSRGPTKAQ